MSTQNKKDAKTNSDVIEQSEVSIEKSDAADLDYHTVLVGLTGKLSTKSNGTIGFELARNKQDKELYIRATSNSDAGLFSKEWISMEAIYTLLDKHKDQPFKSSIFKSVINGASSNNTSFLAAILRDKDIALLVPAEKGIYSHQVNPLITNQQDALNKLKPLPQPTVAS
ncbi:hypothetical protein [Pseudoalteromonas sp. SCSIO 43101]|uniref:hypothetical protein n=1 Tax=Pseudoalteromonas sp. SCSIO 43101 TaxID=2822847 RepID=UPI00202AF30D|nr:hypothetical protein [Pseudoalteromonas sp. SCSIO 43101]URQ89991.1 hypothetical protein J8Z25_14710 [Pseudoalteromonas sp. SCSIO 43101]